MLNPKMRTARICRVICRHAGLVGMWTDAGPTRSAVLLLRRDGYPLSGARRTMFLVSWALWDGSGRIGVWDMLRLRRCHVQVIGEALAALGSGTYAVEAWLARKAPVLADPQRREQRAVR
jgi:hypothetical protein